MGYHVRILGTDGSGKSELCAALEGIDQSAVAFSHTPPHVIRWLRTHGIGHSDTVTPDQIGACEHIFLRFNEHEAAAVNDVLADDRSVVAVRGRADTVLTHSALKGQPMPHYFSTLFPAGMRPDLLVVLVAPPSAIEARLDVRGQPKTGANSMQFHIRCRELYEDVARLATPHLPVLLFDTAQSRNSPQAIATNVRLALDSLGPVQ